jgi:hypothetical protein
MRREMWRQLWHQFLRKPNLTVMSCGVHTRALVRQFNDLLIRSLTTHRLIYTIATVELLLSPHQPSREDHIESMQLTPITRLPLAPPQGAGLQHIRPNRLDVAKCKNLPVSIVFLPAADIAR